MSAVKTMTTAVVLLAVVVGLIAALAVGRGGSGVGHGSVSVASHHALAQGGLIDSN
jgi:hypothetical protein